MSQTQPQPNYLLFSDVHLGADLVQQTRPWTVSRLREVLRVDRDLAAMIDHYRQHADPERPWRLIIAGDLVDFVGMCIAPRDDAELETPLTADERIHGLGSAADHAAEKMRAVAERHDLIFRKLAQFMADGHSLVLVRGNHDVDFYWEAARQAFVDALVARADHLAEDVEQRASFEARVEFRHWFYYDEGLLYVEHGHQYDANCVQQHLLAPLLPSDPRRISYSFSDFLLRYVVRPTRGLSADGHENSSLFTYVNLGVSMGLRGCIELAFRFYRTVGRIFGAWTEHLGDRANSVRAEHERRMTELADRWKLSSEKLHALSALAAKPVTASFGAIVRSVMLDGVAGVLLSTLAVILLGAFGVVDLVYLPLVAAVLAGGVYALVHSSCVLDASASLRQGAVRIQAVMPVRYVVMGHTHEPRMERIAENSTYVNLGGWAVDDLDQPAQPAPYTHLVIRHVEGGHRAQLLVWDAETGPSEFPLDKAC